MNRPAQYFAAFLIMEGLMIGVFAALDSLLFYFFWEAMLIPMFLIIGIWGGPRRVYATIKFFLYTFLGSVLMLVALIYLYVKSGDYSIASFQALPLSLHEQRWIFLAFLLAFAVKVPMWPVHTWLAGRARRGAHRRLGDPRRDHAEDGRLRLSALQSADHARCQPRARLADHCAVARSRSSTSASWRSCRRDMKKLIAYSSIAHMGFVTLGAFIVYLHRRQHRKRAGRGHGPRRRHGADDLARAHLGRAVPVRRRAL